MKGNLITNVCISMHSRCLIKCLVELKIDFSSQIFIFGLCTAEMIQGFLCFFGWKVLHVLKY